MAGTRTGRNRPTGPPRLIALHPDGLTRSPTRASPARLICDDGRPYWVKSNESGSQVAYRLASELVAGHIAYLLGIGPPVAVVDVCAAAVGDLQDGHNLVGVGFGSQDITGAESVDMLISQGVVLRLDLWRVAAVVAFESWLGESDPQGVVDVTNGELYAIDHETWLSQVQPATSLSPRVPRGLATNLGQRPLLTHYQGAVDSIRALTPSQLSSVVESMPFGHPGWADRSTVEQAIDTLDARRNQLDARALSVW